MVTPLLCQLNSSSKSLVMHKEKMQESVLIHRVLRTVTHCNDWSRIVTLFDLNHSGWRRKLSFSILVLNQGFVPCKSVTTNLPQRFRLEEWDEKFSVSISSCFKRSKKAGESRAAKATKQGCNLS